MKYLVAFSLCVILTVFTSPITLPEKTETEYDCVLRFHIRANSDSEFDMNAKMLVRNAVVVYANSLTEKCKSAEEAQNVLSGHLEKLTQIAELVLAKQGICYGAKAYFVCEEFPKKEYGGVVFPQGRYRALRVDLGDGDGQNFWCVLFPPICLADACTEEILDEYGIDDFTPKAKGKVIIKFRLWEEIKKLFSRKR